MNWGTAALRLCSIFPASWKREFPCSSSLKFSLLFSSFPFPSLLSLSLSPSLSLCFLVLLYDGVTLWAHTFRCGLLLSSAFWVNSMLCLLMLFPSQSWRSDIQFRSFTQSCLTFCYPMDCSTRLPCTSPTPRDCSDSCPSSQWCHPTISFSIVPFSSCFLSFPASGSFPMSQFFASCGQSTGVSASASVLPMNIQDWSPLGWTGWISLQSKGLSRVCSNTTVQKHQFFGTQLSLPLFKISFSDIQGSAENLIITPKVNWL